MPPTITHIRFSLTPLTEIWNQFSEATEVLFSDLHDLECFEFCHLSQVSRDLTTSQTSLSPNLNFLTLDKALLLMFGNSIY